jgi:hypothetical protein
MDFGPPIYQAYVDAVKSNMQRNAYKLELGLKAVELEQNVLNIQNQIAERKAITAAYAQEAQAQQQGQTGTNPVTGQANVDPAEKTAAVYDRIAKSVGLVNPKLALEYTAKASTLRDQALTRTKNKIEIAGKQTEEVGKIFGSIEPTDQEGYTAALQKASDMGVDISKFGLSGNVAQDWPKLQQIAKQTLTFKDKMNEAHQKVTEDQADKNYREKVFYDHSRLSLEGAKVGMEANKIALQKQFHSDELNYRARSDARAQAGLERTDAMDLSKSKDFAGRPGKMDMTYAASVIDSDPQLALLPDNQKKNLANQLVLGARAELSKSVTKPGQSVTADDFTSAVQRLLPIAKKGVDPGAKGGFLGIGQKDAALKSPLPSAIETKDQFNALATGAQFRKGDKLYKKTGANQYEEIK